MIERGKWRNRPNDGENIKEETSINFKNVIENAKIISSEEALEGVVPINWADVVLSDKITCKVLEEYANQKVLQTLIDLVKKGHLDIKDAATQMGMSLDEFKNMCDKNTV